MIFTLKNSQDFHGFLFPSVKALMGMSVYIPCLGIGRYDNVEEKVDIILQVSQMRAQLHQLTDAVKKIEKCKACKKRYYKSADDGDVSFEDKPPRVESTPPTSVSAPPRTGKCGRGAALQNANWFTKPTSIYAKEKGGTTSKEHNQSICP